MTRDEDTARGWYIEAIDARAGAAFATYRAAGNVDPAAPFDDGPGFFIEPPFFVPEGVASRTLALAMTHRRGQTGVYLEGQELAFDSLSAVVEFVRRTYLRGSAGDGGGENGVVPPVPPVDGDDDFVLPPLETEGPRRDGYGAGFSDDATVDAVAMWQGFAKELESRSRDLTGGSSRAVGSVPFERAMNDTDMTVQRIGRGALTTLRMLYRMRVARYDEATLLWSDGLHRFLDLVTRMGLWPTMRAVFEPGTVPATVLDLPIDMPPVTDLEQRFLNMVEYDAWSAGLGGWWRFAPNETDPFESLALMPVPPRLVAFDPSIAPNLQALLSVAVSTPAALVADGSRDIASRFEVALFAAACLNARDASRAISGMHPRDLAAVVTARLARRTLAWLGPNLPTSVYASSVEQVVESASKIPA